MPQLMPAVLRLHGMLSVRMGLVHVPAEQT
jgi:hypothetical protein